MVPFQFCYLGANTDDEFRKEIRFAKKKKKDFDFSRLCSDCCFSLLRKIKHPHIVSYYGLSVDPGSSVLRLVTEFVEGGSLLDWLREDSSNYPQECYFRVCQVKKRKNSRFLGWFVCLFTFFFFFLTEGNLCWHGTHFKKGNNPQRSSCAKHFGA